MEKAIYVFSEGSLTIERLHLCSWAFLPKESYIEVGVEIDSNSITKDDFKIFLSAPFIKEKSEIKCLMKNLSDRQNSRFIFNDVVKNIENVGNDERDGCILNFSSRDRMAILPCEIENSDRLTTLTIQKPDKYEGLVYLRILIKVDLNLIEIERKGIARISHIYDLKVNESRNIPQTTYDIMRNKKLNLCKIETVFCFHVISENYELNFIDTTKLKNVRRLEIGAFNNYLQGIKSIKKDSYNIMFLKDCNKDGYSFFTVFGEETIGRTQIILAILTNILCNSIFSVLSWRQNAANDIAWYEMPVEYWFFIIVSIVVSVIILSWQRLFR